MIRISFLALAVIPIVAPSYTQAQGISLMDSVSCVVARVVDGDTLACASGERVRLLLIDAPEMDQQPFGTISKLFLEQLAPTGSSLRVERDIQKQDRYRRELAYLFSSNGEMINRRMIRAGMAVVSVYQPNIRYVDVLRAAADSAKVDGVGLWATNGFECLPADRRANRCD